MACVATTECNYLDAASVAAAASRHTCRHAPHAAALSRQSSVELCQRKGAAAPVVTASTSLQGVDVSGRPGCAAHLQLQRGKDGQLL
jgi:hypothetical protein